jgi:DNA-binding transcriptional ArsR family regulator
LNKFPLLNSNFEIFFSHIAKALFLKTALNTQESRSAVETFRIQASERELFVNMQVVKALASPTRIRILDAIANGPATLAELSARIGEAPSVIRYHLRVLRATGCVRLTEDAPVRTVDRPYELAPSARPTRRVARPPVPESGPGHPPVSVVKSMLEQGRGRSGEDLFGERRDQLSCASIVVDRQGWQEISTAIGEALDRISTAHDRSAERLSTEGAGESIEATIAVATFESPSRRAA